ncbi:MAG: hypothetical protein ABIP91_06955 [Sphingomicrobium sp.]
MKFIIVIALLFVAVVVVLTLRPSGPRITTIEHRRDETDEIDDRKDGDDA